MATLTMAWFGKGLDSLCNGAIDWDTDTFKITLHTATYTPNQDTDDFFNDCTNELSTANGYTAGGATLASCTRTYDAASNEERLDASDTTWTITGSITFRYCVIRKARGGASSADEVVGYGDFGSNQTISTDILITWAATGILKITAS